MNKREQLIAMAFKNVTFALGTSQKRFAQAMIWHVDHMPEKPLTPKQARYLTILAWRYRRQMPAELAYPMIGDGDEGLVHPFESVAAPRPASRTREEPPKLL